MTNLFCILLVSLVEQQRIKIHYSASSEIRYAAAMYTKYLEWDNVVRTKDKLNIKSFLCRVTFEKVWMIIFLPFLQRENYHEMASKNREVFFKFFLESFTTSALRLSKLKESFFDHFLMKPCFVWVPTFWLASSAAAKSIFSIAILALQL